jgi:hypothetical protein
MLVEISVCKGSGLNSSKIRSDISNNIAYVMPITYKNDNLTDLGNHAVGRVRSVDSIRKVINVEFIDTFDISSHNNLIAMHDNVNKKNTIFYLFDEEENSDEKERT